MSASLFVASYTSNNICLFSVFITKVFDVFSNMYKGCDSFCYDLFVLIWLQSWVTFFIVNQSLKEFLRGFSLLVPAVRFLEYIFMFLHFMANVYHGQVNPDNKYYSPDLYWWTVKKCAYAVPPQYQSRVVCFAASITILKHLFIKADRGVRSSVLLVYYRASIYNRSVVDSFYSDKCMWIQVLL